MMFDVLTYRQQLSELQSTEAKLVEQLNIHKAASSAGNSEQHSPSTVLNMLNKKLEEIRTRIFNLQEKLRIAHKTPGLGEVYWEDGHLLRKKKTLPPGAGSGARSVSASGSTSASASGSSAALATRAPPIDMPAVVNSISERMQAHTDQFKRIDDKINLLVEAQAQAEEADARAGSEMPTAAMIGGVDGDMDVDDGNSVSVGAKRPSSSSISQSSPRPRQGPAPVDELAETVHRLQIALGKQREDLDPLPAYLQSAQDAIIAALERQLAARPDISKGVLPREELRKQIEAVVAQVTGVRNTLEDLEQQLSEMEIDPGAATSATADVGASQAELRTLVDAVRIISCPYSQLSYVLNFGRLGSSSKPVQSRACSTTTQHHRRPSCWGRSPAHRTRRSL
jgi:hypothetical protein